MAPRIRLGWGGDEAGDEGRRSATGSSRERHTKVVLGVLPMEVESLPVDVQPEPADALVSTVRSLHRHSNTAAACYLCPPQVSPSSLPHADDEF
uniref:Uncharacterized protein n=1 Tax=Oryza sativa subsp. japonica TaxID=39947 RepID=Q6Z077_ORYSJ|nr:hypothetical protein [Oryza sativa Japonica Group]BAD03679.1 hypothetical protein [Oryza sativa Japonica Group]